MGTDTLKFGWAGGGHNGIQKKVSNSYFNRTGGAFVAASGPDGVKLITASTETPMGWAEVPRDTSAGTVNYWQRSATTDTVFVITDSTAIFACPVIEKAASLAASVEGYGVCASVEGATTTSIQKIRLPASATAANRQFECVKADLTRRVIYVRMNPTQKLV